MTNKERANLEALCAAGPEGEAPGELPYPRIVASMIEKGWVERIQTAPVIRVKATSEGCEQIEE